MGVAEYVKTEIGLIPHDWQLLRLEDFCNRVGDGIHTTPNYDSSGDYHFINGNNLTDGKIIVTEETKRISKGEYLIHKRDLGDSTILLSINGTIGNIAFYKGEKIVLGKSAAYLNLNERVDKRLIFQILQNASVKRYFENELTGSTIKNLGLGSIRNTPIALPKTKIEQTAIASALSDIDALITSLEKLIAKKRNIKQGAMQELLKPKKGWEMKRLGEISTLKGRIGWQGLKQTEFTMNQHQPFLITGMNFKDGEIAWDEVYHISEERYEVAKEIQLKHGDVLMTKDGTIGKLLFVESIPYPGKASLNSHLLLFRPIKKSYYPKFLYYQLGSENFKEFVESSKSGSTFFGISQSSVSGYKALFPKYEEQVFIADTLSDMDEELSGLESKLEKYRQIKSGMMQNLLTGKIRLV